MIKNVGGNKWAINNIKSAFKLSPDDFELFLAGLDDGTISLYNIVGDNHNIIMGGEILDDAYFIWGITGEGLIDGLVELGGYVKKVGLNVMQSESKRSGMFRLLSSMDNVTFIKKDSIYFFEMEL